MSHVTPEIRVQIKLQQQQWNHSMEKHCLYTTLHREKGKTPKRQKDKMKPSSTGAPAEYNSGHIWAPEHVSTHGRQIPAAIFSVFTGCTSLTLTEKRPHKFTKCTASIKRHAKSDFHSFTTTRPPHNGFPTIQGNNAGCIFSWIIWQGYMK